MKKEDLQNFTKNELDEMLVNLINEMEQSGNKHLDDSKKFKKDKDELFETFATSYGTALITRVNRIKNIILLKNTIL